MKFNVRALLPVLVAISMPAAAQDAGGVPPRPAKLMVVGEDATTRSRSFYGRVQARQTVDLAFQSGGQIEKFPVAEGSKLAKGELVAQLDLIPFQQALERAEVSFAKAERDLERLQKLSSTAVAEVEVRNAQTTRDLARIDVAEARKQLENATLTAPFDALVARREAARYDTVAAGQTVARLHDMSELRVDIDVPEVLYSTAAKDGVDGVTFTATFPGHREDYDLVLREFEAETADVAQTYTLTLAFTETVPDTILPGASATVIARVDGNGQDGGITVPETALVFDADGEPSVMVFSPDGEEAETGAVSRTPVTIEMRSDVRVAVTEGLQPGDTIVAAGASMLEDGQRVRRFRAMGE